MQEENADTQAVIRPPEWGLKRCSLTAWRWKAYLPGRFLRFTSAPLPVCQLDFATLLVWQPPLRPLEHRGRVAEFVILVRGQAAEVSVPLLGPAREWWMVGQHKKLCMRGAVHWTGGGEVKTRPQCGEPTGLQNIQSWAGEVTVEEGATGRGFRGRRQGILGQLVDPVALLKREAELKSSFFHCKKWFQSPSNHRQSRFVAFCFACKLFTWRSLSGNLFAVNEAAARHVDPALRQHE